MFQHIFYTYHMAVFDRIQLSYYCRLDDDDILSSDDEIQDHKLHYIPTMTTSRKLKYWLMMVLYMIVRTYCIVDYCKHHFVLVEYPHKNCHKIEFE